MTPQDEAKVRKIIEEVIDRSSRTAVVMVFERLGIDLADPDDFKSARRDFLHLRRMRKGSEVIKDVTVKTCVGAVVLGFIYALVEGARQYLQFKQ